MIASSFSTRIEVLNSPEDIFKRITVDVAKWWGGKDFSGKSATVNDEFIVHHRGAHYSKQLLTEAIPCKKLVWLVTDSNLSWLKDQGEWTDTQMIFEIMTGQHSHVIKFTHDGLVPAKESYARCAEGWNIVIKDWLYNLIMHSKPHFEL